MNNTMNITINNNTCTNCKGEINIKVDFGTCLWCNNKYHDNCINMHNKK